MSEPAPKKQDSNSFLMIFVFMLTFMVMFNNDLRVGLGSMVHTLFFPLIGFSGKWPILTILLAGLIMMGISILIRHKFMDWVGMAKNQKVMGAFNKELREARLANDQSRVEKLMSIQKVLMQDQMAQSSNQMKPMVFSMLIIISIFTWVNLFLNGGPAWPGLESKGFSIPWAYNVHILRGGPVWQIMPVWIGIYSLVSIPLGQVVQRILKAYSFEKRMHEMDKLEGQMATQKEEPSEEKYSEDVEGEEFKGDEEDDDSQEEYEESLSGDEEIEEEAEEEKECPLCANPIGSEETKCSKCGAIFVDEEE